MKQPTHSFCTAMLHREVSTHGSAIGLALMMPATAIFENGPIRTKYYGTWGLIGLPGVPQTFKQDGAFSCPLRVVSLNVLTVFLALAGKLLHASHLGG
mmetsp:Transcript_62338/g.103673  ORF Transcript_62338/g.103673 Transcript_62338/m.103673 type:complete len:98 (-) Transcript_62338:1596-1889(-)